MFYVCFKHLFSYEFHLCQHTQRMLSKWFYFEKSKMSWFLFQCWNNIYFINKSILHSIDLFVLSRGLIDCCIFNHSDWFEIVSVETSRLNLSKQLPTKVTVTWATRKWKPGFCWRGREKLWVCLVVGLCLMLSTTNQTRKLFKFLFNPKWRTKSTIQPIPKRHGWSEFPGEYQT